MLLKLSASTLQSFFAPSLEALAQSARLTLDALAARVSCEPLLLYRVSQRRQALPLQLVGPIARELRLSPAAVETSAGAVMDLGRGSRIRIGQSLRAIPPDRVLGDALFLFPIAPTVTPVFG